ncbi:unnamed protein product [Peniophora sp. CBMAI 1063]|nr:unnamed protein product [Peniophora sp. CBMAI 1063]
MFPITCNAFGDIIAVVHLVWDVVIALDDARGATEDYRQFVHVLKTLATVMEECYCLANNCQNGGLKLAVLAEVQRVCGDISRATDSIVGYDRLAETSSRSPREILVKLRWRFLKAPDAYKYVRCFNESLYRLNTLLSILGSQSASQLFVEQRSHALRLAETHAQALYESTREIKTLTQSALHQLSTQTRQHTVEQIIGRPYARSGLQVQRIPTLAHCLMNAIFGDAPSHSSHVHREMFLSILAPFAITGAVFAIHTNMDPRWRVPSLWATVVALVVQVLWLRCSPPAAPGFSYENSITLIDALGERITVPCHFCTSPEVFHQFLDLLYAGTGRDGKEFVQKKHYELYSPRTTQVITENIWLSCTQPGHTIEMGVILTDCDGDLDPPEEGCTYCFQEGYELDMKQAICPLCLRDYQETREDSSHDTFWIIAVHHEERTLGTYDSGGLGADAERFSDSRRPISYLLKFLVAMRLWGE